MYNLYLYGNNKGKRGYVTIDGKRISIGAGVYEISGYSAHADKYNLIRWVKRIRKKPSKIFLVHGELGAKKSLKKELSEIGADVVIAGRKRYLIDV